MGEPASVILPPKVAAFEPCEACSYDLLTDTGVRSCHYYECPYLPEALDVWCPTCRYDFATEDGNPACGETPCCRFARQVAPTRVAMLHAWAEQHHR